MRDSYSYQERAGVRNISWEMFYGLCKGLARVVDAGFDPDVVVGIARGGLYPAMQLSHLLRADFRLIALSRRVRDQVVHRHPVWLVRPDAYLAGARVLVVDEVCDSGETLCVARDEVAAVGVDQVRTCVLYSHSRAADVPDYIGVLTDELVLNPWDRETLAQGRFTPHPEYAAACAMQGIDAEHIVLPIDPLEPYRG